MHEWFESFLTETAHPDSRYFAKISQTATRHAQMSKSAIPWKQLS